MVSKNRDKSSHEEYQYPDEEYVDAEAGVEAEESAAQPDDSADVQEKHHFSRENPVLRMIRENQRVSFVIAVAVVALVAFKILGSNNRSELAEQRRAADAQQQTLQKAVERAKQVNPEISSALATVKQAQRSDHDSIAAMQGELKDLRSAVDQATASQSQLNQAVVALDTQVKQLSQQLSSSQAKPSSSAAKAVKVAPKKKVVYHTRAVVEGRAWIVGSNGLSESVTVGNTVPDYGVVKSIDASRGEIVTSSGRVIGYGDNDR